MSNISDYKSVSRCKVNGQSFRPSVWTSFSKLHSLFDSYAEEYIEFSSIESLLSNKLGMFYLRKFSESVHCKESVDFLNEVRNFEKRSKSLGPFRSHKEATRIYDSYLSSGGSHYVSIDAGCVEEIRKSIEDDFGWISIPKLSTSDVASVENRLHSSSLESSTDVSGHSDFSSSLGSNTPNRRRLTAHRVSDEGLLELSFIFQKAKSEVLSNLKHDILPKFLESQDYQSLLDAASGEAALREAVFESSTKSFAILLVHSLPEPSTHYTTRIVDFLRSQLLRNIPISDRSDMDRYLRIAVLSLRAIDANGVDVANAVWETTCSNTTTVLKSKATRHNVCSLFSYALYFGNVGLQENQVFSGECTPGFQRARSAFSDKLRVLSEVAGPTAPLTVITIGSAGNIVIDYFRDLQANYNKNVNDLSPLCRGATLMNLSTIACPYFMWRSMFTNSENSLKKFLVPSPTIQRHFPVGVVYSSTGGWVNIFDRDDITAGPLHGLFPDSARDLVVKLNATKLELKDGNHEEYILPAHLEMVFGPVVSAIVMVWNAFYCLRQ